MARYKHSDYKQLLMVPVSLEDQIQPGTMEYAIHRLIEERVDTTIFDQKYRNDETIRPDIADLRAGWITGRNSFQPGWTQVVLERLQGMERQAGRSIKEETEIGAEG